MKSQYISENNGENRRLWLAGREDRHPNAVRSRKIATVRFSHTWLRPLPVMEQGWIPSESICHIQCGSQQEEIILHHTTSSYGKVFCYALSLYWFWSWPELLSILVHLHDPAVMLFNNKDVRYSCWLGDMVGKYKIKGLLFLQLQITFCSMSSPCKCAAFITRNSKFCLLSSDGDEQCDGYCSWFC